MRFGDEDAVGQAQTTDELLEQLEHVDVRSLGEQRNHRLQGLEQHCRVLADGVVRHHLEVHLQLLELLGPEVGEQVAAGEADHLRLLHVALHQVEHLPGDVFEGGVQVALTGRKPGTHLRVDDGHLRRGLGSGDLATCGLCQRALEGRVGLQTADERDDGLGHLGPRHLVEQRTEVAELVNAFSVDRHERADHCFHRLVERGAVDLPAPL